MVDRSEKLQALEDVPEFKSYPFSRENGQPPKQVPVYEIARIKYRGNSTPKELYTVGRSPDGTIYGSLDWTWRGDGQLMAVGGDNERAIDVDLVEIYEILIAHEKLKDPQPTRRF